MKNKTLTKLMAIVIIVVVVITIAASCMARFVFLSPSCYSDNENLTEEENYFIKKLVLEAVEDRLSVFASDTNDIYDSTATKGEIVQLDESQKEQKHIFVLINTDFMNSVVKEDDNYRVIVKTYGMESSSDDCTYQIHITKDFKIMFFGLDP